MKRIFFLSLGLIFLWPMSIFAVDMKKIHCGPFIHQQHLLTTFYYAPEPITPATLEAYRKTFENLDVLSYSNAGLTQLNEIHLTETKKENLILLNSWLKKNHLKTKVMLSLAGWSTISAARVFHDPINRKRFIESAIALLKNKNYGLSGLDIDFEKEFDGAEDDKVGFSEMLKQLRDSLNQAGLSHVCLSVDLPPAIQFAKRYADPKLWEPAVDWANLMAYDFYGEYPRYAELSGTIGNVLANYGGRAPHYETTSIITILNYYTHHDLPRQKILIGLPLYGDRYFQSAEAIDTRNGLRQPVLEPSKGRVMVDYVNFYYLMGIYGAEKGGVKIHRYTFVSPLAAFGDHAYWITRKVGDRYEFITYEDPQAIMEIGRYVTKNKFLGYSAWEMAMDIPYSNPNALLHVMNRSLGN